MGREKKITVKPIANTELASHPTRKGRYKKYPLYVRVTYNRSSTRFPIGSSNFWVTEKEVDENKYEGKEMVDLVERIAENERERIDTFGVVALPGSYKIYNYSIAGAIDICLLLHVPKVMESVLTVSEYNEWKKQPIGVFLDSFNELRKRMPKDIQDMIDVRNMIVNLDTEIKVYEWVLGEPGRRKLLEELKAKGGVGIKEISLVDKVLKDVINKGITLK